MMSLSNAYFYLLLFRKWNSRHALSWSRRSITSEQFLLKSSVNIWLICGWIGPKMCVNLWFWDRTKNKFCWAPNPAWAEGWAITKAGCRCDAGREMKYAGHKKIESATGTWWNMSQLCDDYGIKSVMWWLWNQIFEVQTAMFDYQRYLLDCECSTIKGYQRYLLDC